MNLPHVTISDNFFFLKLPYISFELVFLWIITLGGPQYYMLFLSTFPRDDSDTLRASRDALL